MLAPASFPATAALLLAGHLALAAPFPHTAHSSHGVTIVGGQGDMAPLIKTGKSLDRSDDFDVVAKVLAACVLPRAGLEAKVPFPPNSQDDHDDDDEANNNTKRSTSNFLLKRPDHDSGADNQVEVIDEERPVVEKPLESPWYEYETAEEDSALVWPLDTEGLVARDLTPNRKWEEVRRRLDQGKVAQKEAVQEEEVDQEEKVTKAINDAKDAEAKKVLKEEKEQMAALDEKCSKWYSILYVPPMIECIGWEPPWARPGWKGPVSLPESFANEQQGGKAGASERQLVPTLGEEDDETIANIKGPGPVIVDDFIGHVDKEAVDADGIVGSIGPVVIDSIDEA